MSEPLSEARPPESHADTTPASAASEFLSETSADYRDLRRSAAEQRALDPAGTRDLTGAADPRLFSSSPPQEPTDGSRRRVSWAGVLLIGLGVAVGPAYVLYQERQDAVRTGSAGAVSRDGTVTIDSDPAGANVFIDGVAKGVTPLSLVVPAGLYEVELRGTGVSKTISMRVQPGETLRESVNLAPVVAMGRLEVFSNVPGARVFLDGSFAGTTPLRLAEVAAGTHRVTVTAAGGATATRTVGVEAGGSASIVINPQAPTTPPATAVGAGWVAIAAPIELQILEAGEVIGTSAAPRIMLPSGAHNLTLRSNRFEFETTVNVNVVSGGTASVPVAVPSGRLSVNAVPWAEVWLNGRALGQTPVANVSVPVGTHQVVWRHPELGERSGSIDVGASTPARIGIDMASGQVTGR